MKILDAFSGHLSTWFDKEYVKKNVDKNDIRSGVFDILGVQTIEIKPDFNYNMFEENLVINGGQYDLIYADPPHLKDTSENSIMYVKYTALNSYMITSLEIDIINMLNNFYINLKVGGICIIKWCDVHINLVKYIEEHTNFQLMFGTTTKKKNFTKFITMIKL